MIVLLCLSAPAVAGVSGAVRVIDGDTWDVGGKRVRLFGIDAPERGQPCETSAGDSWDCGSWVSKKTRARYQGAAASCDPVDRDHYGRIVAVCHVSGADVGRRLVRSGMAVAYRKYSDLYLPDEMLAKRDRVGLHAGRFQRPSAYRRGGVENEKLPDRTCLIKGNISRFGERIFHVPGQRNYAVTRISAGKGERWFCSAAEARAAGWRIARQ